jgi:ATP-dependent Clp protease adaptor protein ClpS
MGKQKTKPVERSENLISTLNELILYNDDVNSFEFVIESLVEVCGHDPEQAEQCTLIAHIKGRCAIKSGSFNELRLMSEELARRGLTVTID